MSMGYIRATARRFYLTSTCVIEAEQGGKDANFMNTGGWSEVATVRCRVLPAGQGGTDRVAHLADQESIKVIKRIAVPYDTALDVGQRITVGSEIYYVVALETDNTDESFRQAVIIQRKGADND